MEQMQEECFQQREKNAQIFVETSRISELVTTITIRRQEIIDLYLTNKVFYAYF